ncbi:MAG TPA: hypothetical protein VFT64_01145 [Rickettsiales bacterium]|nr:hypothetical protein [Rickettsiales bacterium]
MNISTNGTSTFQQELDSIVTSTVQLQITCMMLQHEGCNMIRNGDSEKGLIMLEAVRKMRASLEEQNQEVLDTAGPDELSGSQQRTGFNKTLYTTVSDAVIKDNTLYFDLARPADPAYKCDDITCKAKTFALAREYFPSFYEKAA